MFLRELFSDSCCAKSVLCWLVSWNYVETKGRAKQ